MTNTAAESEPTTATKPSSEPSSLHGERKGRRKSNRRPSQEETAKMFPEEDDYLPSENDRDHETATVDNDGERDDDSFASYPLKAKSRGGGGCRASGTTTKQSLAQPLSSKSITSTASSSSSTKPPTSTKSVESHHSSSSSSKSSKGSDTKKTSPACPSLEEIKKVQHQLEKSLQEEKALLGLQMELLLQLEGLEHSIAKAESEERIARLAFQQAHVARLLVPRQEGGDGHDKDLVRIPV